MLTHYIQQNTGRVQNDTVWGYSQLELQVMREGETTISYPEHLWHPLHGVGAQEIYNGRFWQGISALSQDFLLTDENITANLEAEQTHVLYVEYCP